jgi:hypothetical protein
MLGESARHQGVHFLSWDSNRSLPTFEPVFVREPKFRREKMLWGGGEEHPSSLI